MINYYLITKPGIVLGNLLAVIAGFVLGSKGQLDILLFMQTLLGITCIMASACVFNNYIDRDVDRKMERTKERAIAAGMISKKHALLYGCALEIIGSVILMTYTNLLTVAIAGIGFVVYVFLYSMWKCRTIYGTAIGSIAGAVPPVVGYCAASGRFDFAAALLFAVLVLWQMPHFFAIAMLHMDDYSRAGIPVLPVARGVQRTKVQATLYISAFIPVTLLLHYYGFTGSLFFWTAALISGAWLFVCVRGFRSSDDRQWAQQMFMMSLVMIGALCAAIPAEKLL